MNELPRYNPIRRLPVVVLVPDERCNCRCVMCDYWRTPSSARLDVRQVESWLDDWQRLGVKRVIISGGEPLLVRELPALLRLLSSAGFEPTVLTAGLQLARRARSLVDGCTDYVVSLDGPPAVHDEVRGMKGSFERLAAGLAALRSSGRTVTVTARCTVQRRNHRHLRRVVETALALEINCVSFFAVDVSGRAFSRRGHLDRGRASELLLDESDLAALQEEIDHLEEGWTPAFACRYIAESPAELRRRLVSYFGALLGLQELVPEVCNAPWGSAVIDAEGTVRPCFFHEPYGSLGPSHDLSTLVNMPAAVRWRDALRVQEDPVCRWCVCRMNVPASLFGPLNST